MTSSSVQAARFISGSIMRHVMMMTLTGAIGLMALFLVDLADLFFLSLLDRTEITAAIGFAGTIAFINLSLSIGLGIAGAALVARNLGAGDKDSAQRFATNSLAATLGISIALSAFIALFADELLGALGARGDALGFARLYLLTLVPGFPFLACAINCNSSLRAIGDARRAMHATLAVAVINAIFDPLLIFGFGMGIQGAALASVLASMISFSIAFYGLHFVHRFLAVFSFSKFTADLAAIFAIAGPAVLTQLATPFMIAYLTRASAQFGDEVVAAVAIINRLTPVAFGVVFSLSAAVGPIIGQNFGAGEFARVRRTLIDAMMFSGVYTLATALILLLLREHIPAWFLAKGDTAYLVTLYCTWLAFTWAFAGAQFVAQAAFNNLGRAHWSTFFNWGKVTIGTIPFIHLGAWWAGATGIIIASVVGQVLFGTAAALVAFRLVDRLSISKPKV
ncbi:MAG: MATE family efflux transporter [Rhizobiales bacterium]|nr:MATE family efflux transporter [Hyphomicrobiales bacterium]